MRKYSYTILLSISFLVAAIVWKAGWLDFIQADALAGQPAGSGNESVNIASAAGEEPASPEQTQTSSEEGDTKDPSENPAEEQPAPEPVPVFYEASEDYFDDALFIGDSRTVGLSEYGGLGKAEVFADTGMSVYKILKREQMCRDGEKRTLEALLQEYSYKKIYLMLGINEQGYDFETTVERYRQLAERIRELQPETILFLEANLHISKEESESPSVHTNENINRFNEAVAQMADGNTSFYLDVNELFDDEEGNLAAEYTADGAHIFAKHYAAWADWLLAHAVKYEMPSDDESAVREAAMGEESTQEEGKIESEPEV